MVRYYTTADSTTASNYYDWDHLSTATGTSSTSIPSWQSYTFISNPYSREQEINCEQRHRENQELLEQHKAEAGAKEKAREKARVLLLEYLDDKNKQRYLDNKPLEIASRLFGGVRYYIPIAYGRIKAWKDNKIITELCLTVKESELPLEDVILTKFLYLLNDEKNVIKTANHFNVQENLLAILN